LGKDGFICVEQKSTPYDDSSMHMVTKLRIIHVRGIILFALALLVLVISFLFWKELGAIANKFGGGRNWSERMSTYRLARWRNGLLNNVEEALVPSRILWCFQFTIMTGYVFIYIVVNNYLTDGKIDYRLILLVVVLMLVSTLTAARNTLLRYPISALVIYYLLWRKKNGWKCVMSFKFIIRIFILLVLVLEVFIVMRRLVGRLTLYSPMLDLTRYVGGPLQLLDIYLQNPTFSSGIFDIQTFDGIINFFARWFPSFDIKYFLTPGEVLNGVIIGNAYSVFKDYIHDFGYVGTFIMSGISSAIYSVFYKRCRFSTRKAIISCARPDFIILFYAYISFGVFLQFYGHSIFRNIMHIGEIKNIFFMYISFRFFTSRFVTLHTRNSSHLRYLNGVTFK
jgi:oligosaccharide repeat unit polymerase